MLRKNQLLTISLRQFWLFCCFFIWYSWNSSNSLGPQHSRVIFKEFRCTCKLIYYYTMIWDFLVGNRSNQSLSSEISSSTFGNQSSSGSDSILPKLSFTITSVICIEGFLGNSAIIIGFLVKKKVQKPTFTAIFCSSIADLATLLFKICCNIVYSHSFCKGDR